MTKDEILHEAHTLQLTNEVLEEQIKRNEQRIIELANMILKIYQKEDKDGNK